MLSQFRRQYSHQVGHGVPRMRGPECSVGSETRQHTRVPCSRQVRSDSRGARGLPGLAPWSAGNHESASVPLGPEPGRSSTAGVVWFPFSNGEDIAFVYSLRCRSQETSQRIDNWKRICRFFTPHIRWCAFPRPVDNDSRQSAVRIRQTYQLRGVINSRF